MILDDVTVDVLSQMNQQSRLGVRITRHNEVPETGPTNSGRWFRVPQVTAVFADLKNSTGLNVASSPKDAAFAYTYFIRAMTVALDRFSAQYIDIQGDGIFGLFSGAGSKFNAAACAVTMQTLVEREVAARFKEDSASDWKLTAGIGVDCDTLLVRRLGLRGTKMNEVWAGKPVSVAAKLSSVAGRNQVVVSERTLKHFQSFSRLRRKALLHSPNGTYALVLQTDELPALYDDRLGTLRTLADASELQSDAGVPYRDRFAAWSPNSSEFILQTNRESIDLFRLISSDGGERNVELVRRITTQGYFALWCEGHDQWSPGGDHFVVHQREAADVGRHGRDGLAVLSSRPSGFHLSRLLIFDREGQLERSYRSFSPNHPPRSLLQWSPDGRWLAFGNHFGRGCPLYAP